MPNAARSARFQQKRPERSCLPIRMDLHLPYVLADKYRLEERIAAGGMGQVFRATQLNLQRAVAVKLMSPALAGDPTFARKFCFEAAMLAQLVHPNIVTVHDYG